MDFKEYIKESSTVIKTGRYVYHKANPKYRSDIFKLGIRAFSGNARTGKYSDGTNLVFATNSNKEDDWFDSTWDDDTWKIDTSKIKNVVWSKDENYGPNYKHIVTTSDIPKSAIKLIYKGTGDDN